MLSDYLENRIIDWLFRGQSYSPPATLYVSLLTADPADSAAGAEVSYAGYARVAVSANMTNFAGTQGDGTTAVSSGSSGETSNNTTITFATPGATVGTPVTHWALYDAASGGNRLLEGVITNSGGTPISKTLTGGDAVTFPPGTMRINIDV